MVREISPHEYSKESQTLKVWVRQRCMIEGRKLGSSQVREETKIGSRLNTSKRTQKEVSCLTCKSVKGQRLLPTSNGTAWGHQSHH